MAKKYFIYSEQQLKLRKDVEYKMGRKFRVGHVIVNGTRKPFTELSSSPKSIYSDAKIVAETDDIDLMRYTLPQGGI